LLISLARAICKLTVREIVHRVWYRAFSLRYACIRSSGIIFTSMLTLCQILFLWRPLLLS